MNDERLAEVVSALEEVGVACLVMGGHAVRFYGLARNTDDVDLHIAPDTWQDLPERLGRSSLFAGQPVVEGISWRAGAFRRFRIGALPDGRDEWLECWRTNHLLGPFAELLARAELGIYGGREIHFLGLPDLIRSKETERDKDWRDVIVLEQILDAQLIARVRAGETTLAQALGKLRSRTGFDTYLAEGFFEDEQALAAALAETSSPVTQAYLIPFAPLAATAQPIFPIEPVILEKLKGVAPGSSLHHSLVEILRRRYIAFCKQVDRADKEAIRANPG